MSSVRGLSAALTLLLAVLALCPLAVSARAEAADGLAVACRVCELDKDAKYEYTSATSVPQSMAGGDVMGRLTLEGDVRQNGYRDSYPVYEVQSGNLNFRYSFDEAILKRELSDWRIMSDSGEMVNEIDLGAKIGRGALILQASLDGGDWEDIDPEIIRTDIFKANSSVAGGFYGTNDIQLQNGCYFRIAVAHWDQRMNGKKKGKLGSKHVDYDDRKVVEVYEFYVISSEVTGKVTSAADTPRWEFSNMEAVERDSGYAKTIQKSKSDPHFGWSLGSFIVNGYTSKTTENGRPVFIKTLGDKVTLWFHLNEDIDKLNGDSKLSIAEDTKAYDNRLQIKETNFGRGALFIRFTDHENVVHEPVMYQNYLEACTRTGADTRVQLFEEGDYEVVLDYEIRKDALVDSHTDYRIAFSFSIRNGNCMVYPFDLATGNELTNGALAPEGFRLDLAKSRYLRINVVRSIPVVQADGMLMLEGGTQNLDVRFNSASRDGAVYTDEGIYTFTVSNDYTKQQTKKTIYVGTNRYLRAMSRSGFSVAELNSAIGRGATVAEDGEIIEPVVVTQPPQTAKPTSTPTVRPTATPEPEPEPAATIPGMVVPIGIAVAVVLILAIVIIRIRRGKGGSKQ